MRQRLGIQLPYRLLFLVARCVAVVAPDSAAPAPSGQEWPTHEALCNQGDTTHEPFIQAAMHRQHADRPAVPGMERAEDRSAPLCSPSQPSSARRRRLHRLSRTPTR